MSEALKRTFPLGCVAQKSRSIFHLYMVFCVGEVYLWAISFSAGSIGDSMALA